MAVEKGAVDTGFSELQMIMAPGRWSLPRRVQYSFEQELDVVIVDAGDGVPEVDGESIGKARCHPEHPLLPCGTGKVAGVQGSDRGWPVNDGRCWSVNEAASDADVLAGEVGAVQPGLGDEQFGGGLQAVEALGVGARSATASRVDVMRWSFVEVSAAGWCSQRCPRWWACRF
jgi:hypothetical protein